ncbi:MAG: glycosyltransferase, partial [Desulfobacula sp.]|nr:glycosyltransferase [Desulfobacula sp.]
MVDFFRTINAGTENQLSHLLSELPSSGFSVQLISLQDSPFLKNEAQKLFPDVEIISLGAQSDISRSIGSLIRLFFLLFKRRPTIVHTFFPTSNSIGIIIAFFTSNRSLFSSRRDLGYNLSKKDIFLLRMANLFVSSIIVNAKAVKTRTVEIEKVIPEKIKVIYNGIALKNNIKKQNLSMEEINVGIVANLNRTVKRIDVFINAAVTVVRSYPQVKFKIIGDGHLRNSLEQQVDTLDLNSRIEFLGRRKDVDNRVASIN